ncbi:dihydroneopterin aldolase [Kocuria tytonicola]|uniref:7,8-dihydroneopterin aldolase n=1 Tax=Kocuria tytonicola TaxID=2055946 RepID=A0A3L9L139_9MICC|nr:dihydroneopterin aldolase [Kocuria tytonicola]RLY91689.1 dihydroneopterin aldolase [Kocuria tytonicola]RLZ04033.1 dihydroneopterin aldolase [Kocuria tytonicola]
MDSPHQPPLDRITLTGLGAVGYHGVFEKERRSGQPFFVDLVLHVDLRPAAATDDLTLTVHYGEVAEMVREIIIGTRFQLIEALAEEIARALLASFPAIVALDVTVHKPKAPIDVTFSDVAVSICRTRAGLPDGGAR